MKIILFITLLVTMSSVFGQGKIPTLPKSTSSESKTVKVAPDSKTEGLDLEKYVADYVREKMADWLERGEFESTAEWTKRIESQKAEKEQKYVDEALKKIYGSPYKAPINLTLGRYDADEEYFPMETNGFGDFRLFIKRDRARYLKEGQPTVDYTYGLVQGKLTIIRLSLNDVKALPYKKETGKIKKYYWEEGIWKEGEGNNYSDDDTSNEIFNVVDDLPQFPEGNLTKWISKNVKYPQVAMKNGIQGKVFVKFIIEKDGSITNVQISRGVDASLDKEAIRVIKSMPKWKPGTQRGKAVRVSYTTPINFQL